MLGCIAGRSGLVMRKQGLGLVMSPPVRCVLLMPAVMCAHVAQTCCLDCQSNGVDTV